MNKLTIFSFLQLAATAATAQVPYLIYAGQTFKGKIDNQYEIVVNTSSIDINDESLPAEGAEVYGSYYYTSTQKPMNLSGMLFETDRGYKMELKYMKEENGTKTLSERFLGDMSSDGRTWKGTWSKPSKGKELSFSVERQTMPYRDLFMRFLETKIRENAGDVFGLDLAEGARFGIVDGMPFIEGLLYEGGGEPSISFSEGYFHLSMYYERFGGGTFMDETYQLLPNGMVLYIYSGGDEQEMEDSDTGETSSGCSGSVGAEVYQWDGSSWKDVTKKVFPSGSVVTYTNPEDASRCEVYIRRVGDIGFEIGATEATKTLWKFDGQRFVKG